MKNNSYIIIMGYEKEVAPMSSSVNLVETGGMSGDFLLALLIGAGVVMMDYILNLYSAI